MLVAQFPCVAFSISEKMRPCPFWGTTSSHLSIPASADDPLAVPGASDGCHAPLVSVVNDKHEPAAFRREHADLAVVPPYKRGMNERMRGFSVWSVWHRLHWDGSVRWLGTDIYFSPWIPPLMMLCPSSMMSMELQVMLGTMMRSRSLSLCHNRMSSEQVANHSDVPLETTEIGGIIFPLDYYFRWINRVVI